MVHHKLRCVSHHKFGRFFLLRKPFRFFVFPSQTLQIFCLALCKKAQYVVVIDILNQFWTNTQLQSNVDTIHNQCFHTLPNDPKFPYSFYTNEAKQKHNESSFLRSEEDVFILRAQDRHHDTCPQSFQLQNDANFTTRLHPEVQVKKNVLVELCNSRWSCKWCKWNIPRIN